jgi:hypothetical protein
MAHIPVLDFVFKYFTGDHCVAKHHSKFPEDELLDRKINCRLTFPKLPFPGKDIPPGRTGGKGLQHGFESVISNVGDVQHLLLFPLIIFHVL